jgi:hypothetical protein
MARQVSPAAWPDTRAHAQPQLKGGGNHTQGLARLSIVPGYGKWWAARAAPAKATQPMIRSALAAPGSGSLGGCALVPADHATSAVYRFLQSAVSVLFATVPPEM